MEIKREEIKQNFEYANVVYLRFFDLNPKQAHTASLKWGCPKNWFCNNRLFPTILNVIPRFQRPNLNKN